MVTKKESIIQVLTSSKIPVALDDLSKKTKIDKAECQGYISKVNHEYLFVKKNGNLVKQGNHDKIIYRTGKNGDSYYQIHGLDTPIDVIIQGLDKQVKHNISAIKVCTKIDTITSTYLSLAEKPQLQQQFVQEVAQRKAKILAAANLI